MGGLHLGTITCYRYDFRSSLGSRALSRDLALLCGGLAVLGFRDELFGLLANLIGLAGFPQHLFDPPHNRLEEPHTRPASVVRFDHRPRRVWRVALCDHLLDRSRPLVV